MKKTKGIPSLIAIVVVIWGLLKATHVLLPLLQPQVLPGPFDVSSLGEVEEITRFSPLVPAYHPASLGGDPVRIVAQREPEPMVTILWRSERFLELIERPVRGRFESPDDAVPVPGEPAWRVWRRGGATHLARARDGVQIELRTNLSRDDAIRIASTLLPLRGGASS